MKTLLFIFLLLTNLAFAKSDALEAYALVKAGQAIMFDVREADEVKTGMINLAVLFSKSKFDADPNWKKDFDNLVGTKKVYLYCRSGRRSEIVQELLKKQGTLSVNLGAYEDLRKILPTSLGL